MNDPMEAPCLKQLVFASSFAPNLRCILCAFSTEGHIPAFSEPTKSSSPGAVVHEVVFDSGKTKELAGSNCSTPQSSSVTSNDKLRSLKSKLASRTKIRTSKNCESPLAAVNASPALDTSNLKNNSEETVTSDNIAEAENGEKLSNPSPLTEPPKAISEFSSDGFCGEPSFSPQLLKCIVAQENIGSKSDVEDVKNIGACKKCHSSVIFERSGKPVIDVRKSYHPLCRDGAPMNLSEQSSKTSTSIEDLQKKNVELVLELRAKEQAIQSLKQEQVMQQERLKREAVAEFLIVAARAKKSLKNNSSQPQPSSQPQSITPPQNSEKSVSTGDMSFSDLSLESMPPKKDAKAVARSSALLACTTFEFLPESAAATPQKEIIIAEKPEATRTEAERRPPSYFLSFEKGPGVDGIATKQQHVIQKLQQRDFGRKKGSAENNIRESRNPARHQPPLRAGYQVDVSPAMNPNGFPVRLKEEAVAGPPRRRASSLLPVVPVENKVGQPLENVQKVKNALRHVCLAGLVNEVELLQVNKIISQLTTVPHAGQHLKQPNSHHLIILVKDPHCPLYRGLYRWNSGTELSKLYGCGPQVLSSSSVETFLKYDSAGKRFHSIVTRCFDVMVDAVTVSRKLKE